MSIKPLTLFGRPVGSDQEYAVLCVFSAVLASWLFLTRITRTDMGRAFRVVRESELVARGMGIDVSRAKAQAFLLSGFFAGICGALFAFTSRGSPIPEAFEIALSVDQTAMIIVGGLGSFTGSIIGAVFVTLLPEAIERLGRLPAIHEPDLRLPRDGLRHSHHPLPAAGTARPRRTVSAAWNAQKREGRGAVVPQRKDQSFKSRRSGARWEVTMKKLVLGAAVAALLAAAPARADITVCAWGTITGPDALVNGMTYGTADYLKYLNETKGGVAGEKIKVLMLDGRYKLDEELKIYRRCADQEQAVVINGWSTGASKALRDQIQQDGIPFISESFASEVLDPEKFPFTFIAGPTYEQQMIIALRDLAAKGGKNVVLMYSDNEYGRGPGERGSRFRRDRQARPQAGRPRGISLRRAGT